MSYQFSDLIKQNIATVGASSIEITSPSGRCVGRCPLGHLSIPSEEIKLYSFLAIADSHLAGSDTTSGDSYVDLKRALQYGKDNGVAFACVCGDVIDTGTNEWYYQQAKAIRDGYDIPVYYVTGNHEAFPTSTIDNVNVDYVESYYTLSSVGADAHPLYYSFTQGDDVFIMLGEYSSGQTTLFADGELDFLEDTLDANRNKRCFVFFHPFSCDDGDSGLPYKEFYNFDLLETDPGNSKERFLNLLKHYKNCIWFHGHSHANFELQRMTKNTVYSDTCGYRSVHIPSITKPKTATEADKEAGNAGTAVDAESQGYIVDVYPNAIHLRGRDFVSGEFLPIASYWIDTTLQEVEGVTKYSITRNLTGCYSDSDLTEIEEGATLSETIYPTSRATGGNDMFGLYSLIMGGEYYNSSPYVIDNGNTLSISLPSVTGDVVITVEVC